jgi:predicted ATPase
MLTRAEITNYKSVAQASLSFSAENVIVGPNGVGKSNLLDAIHFIRDAARDGLDHAVTKRHGIVSIRRWSKTRPYNISIKLVFKRAGMSGEYRVVIASAAGDFSVLEEEGIWDAPNPMGQHSKDRKNVTCTFKRLSDGIVSYQIPENVFANTTFPNAPTSELILNQFGSNIFSPASFFFRGLYDQIVSCGAYSIYPNKIREPQSISNLEVLSDDGTNLASIIRQMRSTTSRANRESLTLGMRQVIPILTEIRIESAGGFYVPVFRVKEPDNGYTHDLNMSQLSDGTLRMLGMLTAFYQPKAPVRITMEEPEQMIHPGLLPILIEAGRDYLDAGTARQAFFTTHSPGLLDLFEPASIIAASYVDGTSRFAPISKRQLDVIKDKLFSAGELLMAEGIMA